jgi:hypothetical protein
MKLKTILLSVTSVTAAHGATTVTLANFAGASSGLPIVDNTGTPIAKADSLLQVGTFTQAFADSLGGLDTRTSDQDVIDAFTAAGTGRGMTFDGLFNGSIDSDSDGFLGAAATPLYALITYTPAGADPQAMVLNFGNTFPEQNAVGAASVDLGRSIALGDVVFGNTASTVPVSVDSFPPPLQNDNFKQGLTFDGGVNGVLFNTEKTVLLAYPAGETDANYTIPYGVTSIGDSAFLGSSSLESITIPESVESIGGQAFFGCSSLTSITIPDAVNSIKFGAFGDCTSLTTIEVGAGNVNYTVSEGVLFNKEKTLLHTYPAGKTDANYTIPDSVTSIEASAFLGSSSLESITIPDGVTSIGTHVFYNCSSLESITFEENSLLTSIGNGAFFKCTNLTSITIPDSVTSIEGSAFNSCSSLTSITIPESVTSIGDYAFSGCTSLTSITFMGAAPTVGVNAFFRVADGARAGASNEFVDSFGGTGNIWERLTVTNTSSTRTIEATIVTGSGSVAGGGTFITGSSVTLTATPDADYVFIGWSGDATGSVNPLTLTIERGMDVGAIFIKLASHGLVTQTSYDVVEAERDARPTQVAYDAAIATARTAGQEDVTSDPASYSLFTEDQIHAMSADPTIGMNDAGNVEMKINFFESADLVTFAPFTVTPESVSVVDGNICLEFTPKDAAFFQLSLR